MKLPIYLRVTDLNTPAYSGSNMASDPFANLRTKLILQFFLIVAHDPDTSVQQRQRSIFAVSRVNQRFRRITLATPNLWTNLHLKPGGCKPYLVQNLIYRSCGLPFTISVDIVALPEEARWPLGYPRSFKFPPARSIILQSHTGLPGFTSPVDALRSLSSATTEHLTIVANGAASPTVPAMPNLLSIDVQRGWILLARDTELPSVKRLCVRSATRRLDPSATFLTFFGALIAMPNLEVLDLGGLCSNVYDAANSEPLPYVGSNFLAQVRSVRLSNVPSWFRRSLLSYCASSRLERVSVTKEIAVHSPAPPTPFLRALGALRSLEVDIPSRKTAEFLTWIAPRAPNVLSLTLLCKSVVTANEIDFVLGCRGAADRLECVTLQESHNALFSEATIDDIRHAVVGYSQSFKFVRACDVVC